MKEIRKLYRVHRYDSVGGVAESRVQAAMSVLLYLWHTTRVYSALHVLRGRPICEGMAFKIGQGCAIDLSLQRPHVLVKNCRFEG